MSISRFVPEECQVIIESILEEYMSVPDSNKKWLSVAKEFEEKWQFPNCVGAIDREHVPLINPSNSGLTYFNYKNFFSIVPLALVDADFTFFVCQSRMSESYR